MKNFNEALEVLKGRYKRKLENNTYLEKLDDDTIGVRLHQTNVVIYSRNGAIHLFSGGWHTVTTKDRINKYAPVDLIQRKRAWYVNGKAFEEGMSVDRQIFCD